MPQPLAERSLGILNIAPGKRLAIIAALFSCVALTALAVLATHRYFDPDEVESMHAGWKILQGEMIYRDFFEHHHPLFYLMLAPLFTVMPESSATLIYMRMLNLLLVAGILTATFDIGRRLFGSAASLAGLILLVAAPIFSSKVIELRPDNLQTFFDLAGLVLLLIHFARRRWYWAAASGLALGLSFVALQKAVFFILAVACIVSLRVLQRRLPWRDPLIMAAGFFAALLPFAVWLATTHSLHAFWILNYRLNAEQAYISDVAATFWGNPAVFLMLGGSIAQSPLLWGFFALSLISAVCLPLGCSADQRRLHQEMAFIAVILVAWVQVLNKFYAQYYLPAMPLIALLAGGAAVQALRARPLVLGMLLAVTSAGSWNVAAEALASPGIGYQLARHALVLQLTKPGDSVMDTRSVFNVFRPDISYMWFVNVDEGVLNAYTRLTGYKHDILDRITAKKPVVISIEGLPPGAWPSDPRLAAYKLLPGMSDALYLPNANKPL